MTTFFFSIKDDDGNSTSTTVWSSSIWPRRLAMPTMSFRRWRWTVSQTRPRKKSQSRSRVRIGSQWR